MINEEIFFSLFPVFKKDCALGQSIFANSQRLSCAKNTNLYFSGDTCSQIAFIVSGEIRVFRRGETGREITLYEIGPGDTCILNASCILSGHKYPADAV
nr:cyclic nucleotide-binding domain-containing protein [Desulfobulbaceae bacterium]